jgi:hypothetical protein
LIFHAYAEWELLREPLKLTGLKWTGPLLESEYFPQWVRGVELSRIENHGIRAMVIGPIDIDHNLSLNVPADPVSIRFTDYKQDDYVVTGTILRHETRDDVGPTGKYFDHVRSVLSIREVTARSTWAGNTTRLTDWFLNGPTTHFLFPGYTKRKLKVQRSRSRTGIRSGTDRSNLGERSEHRHDYVLVRARGMSYMVHSVPSDAGPEWTQGLGIEYRAEWGGIPDHATRDAIAYLVGFVVGRRLLRIGHSEFDENNRPTLRSAVPPNTIHAETMSRMVDLPPVQLVRESDMRIRSDLGTVLRQLTPTFLDKVDQYNLRGALFRYATALDLPLGADLPLLQSAIEMISKGWRQEMKVRGSVEPGFYMSITDFNASFGEELQAVRRKLAARDVKMHLTRREYGERLARKMSRSYEMTGNELMDSFFQGIGITVGTPEREAMRARNVSIHGYDLSAPDTEKWRAYSRAYFTLANRVILRVLGFRGQYVDYTSSHWSPRKLREPASGLESRMEPEVGPTRG